MVRAGVCERAVEHFAPVAGDVPGPVVAGVIVGAAAETVVHRGAQRRAEPPGQDIGLERQHLAVVVELVAHRQEPPGLFGGGLHRGGFFLRQAQRFFAQDVGPVRQAGQRHGGVEVHRRDKHGQVGAVAGEKFIQAVVQRHAARAHQRHAVGQVRVNVAHGGKVRAGVLPEQRFQVKAAVAARADKHDAGPFVQHGASSLYL